MRPVPLAALLAALISLTGATASSAKSVLFHTPSKNIGCVMVNDSDFHYVRCDIGEHSWPLPPKPHTPACRELDLIGGLSLGVKGKSRFFCAGDTVLHQGTKLAYGDSKSLGRFKCTSETSGVTCVNRRNGHGLFLSRASYR